MDKADLFSYLAAFVTIVLAVALGDMIQSTHRLIRARRRVKWDIIPLIFAGTAALAVVSEFFSLWILFSVSQVTLPRLLWLLTVPTLIALLAYSALPDEIPEAGLDLSKFYAEERRYWVVIFGFVTLLDLLRSTEKLLFGPAWMLGLTTLISPIIIIIFLALIIMWIGRSRHWDAAGVVMLAAAMGVATTSWAISLKS